MFDNSLTETRVDVLLPVRGPAPWLGETLAGLLAQTYSQWRLVLVIHGDPTAILPVVQLMIPDASVVMVGADSSFVQVLNEGLSACTSEFIARIDADDIPERDRFREQVNYFDNHGDCALVASRVRRIASTGEITETYPHMKTQMDLLDALRWKNVIAHSTVMMRRRTVDELGGYASSATHVEDYELWLRMAAVAEISMLPSALVRYRIHDEQVSRMQGIPKQGRIAVRKARIQLALQRKDSRPMAEVRHLIWTVPQIIRETFRGSR